VPVDVVWEARSFSNKTRSLANPKSEIFLMKKEVEFENKS
jgi:hypothetical protein